MTNRAKKLSELGTKTYDKEGLIPALAAMIDMATTPAKVNKGDVKEAKYLVAMLKEHCAKWFLLRNVFSNMLTVIQAQVKELTKDDVGILCRYYNEGKDWSWATEKMSSNYLVKNLSTDVARALDWYHGEPDTSVGSKLR